MIKAVSEIVTMESLSDVEVEDINDELFEIDGSPYLFVPEYTDEELLALENERTEREAQRAEQAEVASRPRTLATWCCSCGCCVQMDTEDQPQPRCSGVVERQTVEAYVLIFLHSFATIGHCTNSYHFQ